MNLLDIFREGPLYVSIAPRINRLKLLEAALLRHNAFLHPGWSSISLARTERNIFQTGTSSNESTGFPTDFPNIVP